MGAGSPRRSEARAARSLKPPQADGMKIGAAAGWWDWRRGCLAYTHFDGDLALPGGAIEGSRDGGGTASDSVRSDSPPIGHLAGFSVGAWIRAGGLVRP